MTHLVLVALGAAAGSVGPILGWHRRWSRLRVLGFNVAVSALAGAVAGALDFVAQESVVSSFLGSGLLATAAPFASVLVSQAPPRDGPDAWRFIRRAAGVLAISALFCATAASVTYMIIAGSFFYIRATH
ncbi:hypothetical protein ABGB19_24970 [Mycobacterium sp. B14F4]|uniref:hypothetical protein n=1 Tax=Mycobacterium sp. B14F4 TaxID=3153565 RepID=UPI00325D005C